jgi:hypothetical protein
MRYYSSIKESEEAGTIQHQRSTPKEEREGGGGYEYKI